MEFFSTIEYGIWSIEYELCGVEYGLFWSINYGVFAV